MDAPDSGEQVIRNPLLLERITGSDQANYSCVARNGNKVRMEIHFHVHVLGEQMRIRPDDMYFIVSST